MSPTSIPSARVSSAVFTSSSRTASTVSNVRLASPYSPFTCTEALHSCTVPSMILSVLVWTRTFSVSAFSARRPPRGVSFNRPFALTSATIAPSVSVCACRKSASSLSAPPRSARTPPFVVIFAAKPSASNASLTHVAAFRV